ncbi:MULTISPECIES: cephalosporin hydroxylase family protein [Paraburkholderia]|jgi:cephalosporin hydroxylase|uniref:Cephalosporin hydroxylase n=1 Tax=Paraburkholderia largidicola TaxID=3014751 RepID=A0A7I8BPJ6_9BURK|nr:MULTISPECIES: cephalosporin hydroxylase family protein [Paraburkholderia]BCF90131.1 cephalosporin hydroxylase [Paraburkholderia sp. PGU16]GJG98922.1 class I SAM-dependent methyltransferase [Paraburkholderia terrae]GJH35231.1 class I SAM-dependent methyltransferase [Paraburkholderia hospita]CAG9244857.1 Cephalosporin hydroxylase [Paraburkholderia caribensis]
MNTFEQEVRQRIDANGRDAALREVGLTFVRETTGPRYSYNFSWLGRPIIQYPQDMVAMQELIWEVRPDIIIETGIAHGGSLILSASMLAMLDLCDAIERGEMLDPSKPRRRVVGVDIDIRAHNRAAIEAHPLANRIDLIQGSSVAPDVLEQVYKHAEGCKSVLVCLDSNHTHEHVLAELEAYAPLVTPGSYCVAFDTIIEDLPRDAFPDRPWDHGDNPKTAVWAFVEKHPEFEIDRQIDNKLLISVAPEGYLKRVR